MLKAGLDLSERDSEGNTLLHLAVSYRWNREKLQLLVDAGAKVNARNYQGETPLDYKNLEKRALVESLQALTPLIEKGGGLEGR